MTLTILICVHSTNNFYDSLLSKALDSLENQTYKNFDTLLVLDECWNQTIQTISIKKYNFELTIVEKGKKGGLADAKNYGLGFIKSEWVGFLDGDDLYTPTKLEKQINYINNNDVDFLGCHAWNVIGSDSNNLLKSCFDINQYNTHTSIQERISKENVLTHGSMLIKKKCLENLNGYINIKGMEDWDLWIRAIQKGYKFYQIPERLYIHRLGTSVPR